MKIISKMASLAIALFPLGMTAQELTIVPLPAQIEMQQGSFSLQQPLVVSVPQGADSLQQVIARFVAPFPQVNVTYASTNPNVVVNVDPTIAPEGYALNITPEAISIASSTEAGLFYALTTLSQMAATQGLTLPAVAIVDEPRFGWRGFMLDEGRHIFGKDEVKKVLDMMAGHKLNRFHWHLTEDQGWRIEIKQYPLLTEVGATRPSTKLAWSRSDWPRDSIPYSGYYTQDDIREIVAYAKDRYIEIVPEIDIPGHTQAAVAAYPEILACDPENPHEVWLEQGVSPDVMNVANPAAVKMATDIIDELVELFPFPYLHLGGDECPTDKWEQNAQCQALLAEIGSDNYRDLQLNFYRELAKHIAALPADKQKNLIFWNEVLHGNTQMLEGTPITIMAWVGADEAALDAVNRGLPVILSPQIPYYINRKQSELPTEPMSQGRGTESVERVYAYVPMNNIPADKASLYEGVQANFWSEYVETPEVLEYLMMPRLAAVAEAGWTPQERRQYPDFRNRIMRLAPAYYDPQHWGYAKHIWQQTPAE